VQRREGCPLARRIPDDQLTVQEGPGGQERPSDPNWIGEVVGERLTCAGLDESLAKSGGQDPAPAVLLQTSAVSGDSTLVCFHGLRRLSRGVDLHLLLVTSRSWPRRGSRQIRALWRPLESAFDQHRASMDAIITTRFAGGELRGHIVGRLNEADRSWLASVGMTAKSVACATGPGMPLRSGTLDSACAATGEPSLPAAGLHSYGVSDRGAGNGDGDLAARPDWPRPHPVDQPVEGRLERVRHHFQRPRHRRPPIDHSRQSVTQKPSVTPKI
jgi:hypothetical protein